MEPLKIFLDTNIVLDYLTGRMHDGKAALLVQVGKNPCYRMCISVLTAANVMYISRKYIPSFSPEKLSGLFTILPQDGLQWNTAVGYKMDDFEDSLQSACACAAGCACIITRDSHFLDSPLPVFYPEDFLDTVVKPLSDSSQNVRKVLDY